jgi:hypothetical protein
VPAKQYVGNVNGFKLKLNGNIKGTFYAMPDDLYIPKKGSACDDSDADFHTNSLDSVKSDCNANSNVQLKNQTCRMVMDNGFGSYSLCNPDHDNEIRGPRNANGKIYIKAATDYCLDDEFACDGWRGQQAKCVNVEQRCDRIQDCVDNSDERGCEVGTYTFKNNTGCIIPQEDLPFYSNRHDFLEDAQAECVNITCKQIFYNPSAAGYRFFICPEGAGIEDMPGAMLFTNDEHNALECENNGNCGTTVPSVTSGTAATTTVAPTVIVVTSEVDATEGSAEGSAGL